MSKKKKQPEQPEPTEEELKERRRELGRAIRAKEKERQAYAAQVKEELRPQFEELIRYARRRKHTWLDIDSVLLPHSPSSDKDRAEWMLHLCAGAAVRAFEGEHINPLTNERNRINRELRQIAERRKTDEFLRRPRRQ